MPLTAQEFFAQEIEGASVNDAHYAARVSLTSLNSHMRNERALTVKTANALQAWSETLPKCKVYISAMRTLGVRSEL